MGTPYEGKRWHVIVDVDRFNRLPAAEAVRELLACCASITWAEAVAAGRPYPDRSSLVAEANAALRRLTWDDVAQALEAHPRIGDRPAGADRESAWSRREQSGVDDDPATLAALKLANLEYEERFGHVFLIFATGKSKTDVLEAARARLANDDGTERAIVQEELREIALLRLERMLDEQAGGLAGDHAPLSTHVLDLERGRPAAGVVIRLDRRGERADEWSTVAEGQTDADGRLRDWVPAAAWDAGVYRLVFAVASYLHGETFFPEITVGFLTTEPDAHHHVPLLLNRHGYTTYRGS